MANQKTTEQVDRARKKYGAWKIAGSTYSLKRNVMWQFRFVARRVGGCPSFAVMLVSSCETLNQATKIEAAKHLRKQHKTLNEIDMKMD